MKFFYNGKLVRTSKTRVYTHAVYDIEDEGLVSCHESLELANKALASYLSYDRQIKGYESLLDAVRNGKSFFFMYWANRLEKTPVPRGDTEETVTKRYNEMLAQRDWRIKHWHVVELTHD